MYTQAWNKYVSVMPILLKRAVASEQSFNLNVSDFKQSGATRKSGYKFEIQFVNGRPAVLPTGDIAKDFVTVLLENVKTNEQLQANDYIIAMNTKFQLNIKYVSKEVLQESLEQ